MTVRIGLSSADRFREERSLEQTSIERLSNRLLQFSKKLPQPPLHLALKLSATYLPILSLSLLFGFDSLGGPWQTQGKDENSAQALTEPFRIHAERRRY